MSVGFWPLREDAKNVLNLRRIKYALIWKIYEVKTDFLEKCSKFMFSTLSRTVICSAYFFFLYSLINLSVAVILFFCLPFFTLRCFLSQTKTPVVEVYLVYYYRFNLSSSKYKYSQVFLFYPLLGFVNRYTLF